MKVSVQVLVHPDDDTQAAPVVREVLVLDRDQLSADTLGLQLAEAKDLLAAVQDTLVGQQVAAAVAAGAVPALRTGAAAQGHAHDRGAHPVRHAAPGQPPLVALPLPTTRPPGPSAAGRAVARADHPGAGLPGGQLRRPGLLRHHRQTCSASCCPWAGPCTPPSYAAQPTRSRIGWRASSARNSSASSTPARPSGRNCPARTCRSWSGWTAATSTPPATLPRRRLVRGHRRQGHPRRRAAQPASATCRPTTPNPNAACSRC